MAQRVLSANTRHTPPVLLVQVGYLQDPTAVVSALGQKFAGLSR